MASEDRLRELEDKYEGYKVYDNRGEKIGKVDDLFIDENDREEYVGVKMGLLGMKSTLIPMDIARVNESDKTIEVSESKDHVKDAPSFDDDEEITPEYEDRIRSHFGLEGLGGGGSSYGAYSGSSEAASREQEDRESTSDESMGRDDLTHGDNDRVDTQYGERSDSTEGSHGNLDEDSARESDSRSSDEGRREGERYPDFQEYQESRGRSGERSTEGGEESSDRDSGQSGGESLFGDQGSDRETREMPTSRRTEETETYEEGGRPKVRRRVIREEIIEEDPDRR